MNEKVGAQWRIAQAERIRELMGPEMCAVADALRERFGAKLEWLRTPSLELGKPLPPAEPIGEKAHLRQRCRADARGRRREPS